MGQGCQIWNAAGALMFDSATKCTRLIATINPGLVDGSQSFPGVQNNIVAVLANWASSNSGGFTGNLPDLTVSGTTVSWTYSLPPQFRMNSTILVLGW